MQANNHQKPQPRQEDIHEDPGEKDNLAVISHAFYFAGEKKKNTQYEKPDKKPN